MWPRRRKPEQESKKALADANKNLKKAEDRHEEVQEVSHRLRMFRERNHISEQLREIGIID